MAGLIEIEEALEKLRIEIIDNYRITDGDQEYFIFSVANISENEEEIISKLGELGELKEIKKIIDGVYFCDRTSFDINEILDIFEPMYKDEIKSLWNSLALKIYEINEGHCRKIGKCLFEPANDTLLIVLKWYDTITKSDIEFHSFVKDLNKLIRDSCQDQKTRKYLINEKYKEHKFWEILQTIRNCDVHIKELQNEEVVIRDAKKVGDAYEELMGKSFRTQLTPFEFINGQKNFLKLCHNFLDTILGDF